MNMLIKKALMKPGISTILTVQPDKISLRVGYVVTEGGIPGGDIHADLQGLQLAMQSEFVVHLEELWQQQDWHDACIWGIVYKKNKIPYAMVNYLADSQTSRRNQNYNKHFIHSFSPIKIVVPFAEADFTEMHYYVFAQDSPHSFIANIPFTEVDEAYMVEHRWDALPTLVLSGPDFLEAGATAQCTVSSFLQAQSFTYPLDVHLEHCNGYLPKTRLRLNGTGTFPVQALGLRAGDTLKIKAGFRYLSARAEKIMRII